MTDEDQTAETETRQEPHLTHSSTRRAWFRTRGAGYLLAVAMLAAPAIGALYGLNVALGIATLALLASTALAVQAMPVAPDAVRPRLWLAASLNAAVALICGAVWVLRVFG